MYEYLFGIVQSVFVNWKYGNYIKWNQFLVCFYVGGFLNKYMRKNFFSFMGKKF